MERSSGRREMLDGPLEPRLLADNLRDLERMNRWLGGADLSWRAVEHVSRAGPPSPELRILDVGTGAADIPRALLARAERAGIPLSIEATDVRPEIVAFARHRQGQQQPRLRITLSDPALLAQHDPVDIVHASLVLHHLEAAEARALLADMAVVARRAVIVNDLSRARRWWIGAWLLSRIMTRDRYTRHDAPLSVLRAYQPDEVSAMARDAGLREDARLAGPLGHRYALVLVPGP